MTIVVVGSFHSIELSGALKVNLYNQHSIIDTSLAVFYHLTMCLLILSNTIHSLIQFFGYVNF